MENITRCVPYFAVTVVSIFPHQIHSMAVFIPKRSLVGEGAVGDGNVIVIVIRGEGSVLVIRQGIALRETQRHNITSLLLQNLCNHWV